MAVFEPDYKNLENAARNIEAERLPLYEHIVGIEAMEALTGEQFGEMHGGSGAELDEFFKHYSGFFKQMGYDTVSYEAGVGAVMPGSGALGNSHIDTAIKTRQDFERYPWQDIPRFYFEANSEKFEALRRSLPPGMKAVGGVGNGVFECVQDLVGYEKLCYISIDDPDLYADLFRQVGDTLAAIWKQFLQQYSDIYCVMRFGDDLGYRTSTMLATEDIRTHIIPQYKRIVGMVHTAGKPFLLHSCGCIFEVMEDLINTVGIDAKHSNEDQIAPFPVWVEKYGERIGNFGGIDTDAVCRLTRQEMREYIADVVNKCTGHGGFAFGSGNSIPYYVPPAQYQMMCEILRELRGEHF